MADKYVSLGATGPVEVEASTVSTGAASAGKIMAPGADGRWDASLMPAGFGIDAYTSTAFEALAAGAFVYIKADGTIANASAGVGGNAAVGFVLVASASSAAATLYFEGRNTARSGVTAGAAYFLSDVTAGSAMTTRPVGTGKLYQIIGSGVNSTTINTEFTAAVPLA
jgi:hypothetical protein